MATFSDRLKELRKEKGLTQKDLAKVLYVNQSAISKYELGTNSPENKFLVQLADYFNVSTDYLLGKSDIRTNNKCKEELIEKKLKEILNCFIEAGYDPNEITKEEFKLVLDTYMNLKGIKKTRANIKY